MERKKHCLRKYDAIRLCLGLLFVSGFMLCFQCHTWAQPEDKHPIDPATKMPDADFVEQAKKLVQLIGTYTPDTAKQQFEQARTMLVGPALGEFDQYMMIDELGAINDVKRSQKVEIQMDSVRVERNLDPNLAIDVVVKLPGKRVKTIGPTAMPEDRVIYYVKLAAVAPAVNQKTQIVVRDIRLRKTEMDSPYRESGTAALERQERREIVDILTRLTKDRKRSFPDVCLRVDAAPDRRQSAGN